MLLKKILSTLLKLYSKLVTELPIIYIYTLKTLFDKHLNTNRNEKIYACFVDFKKAFDLGNDKTRTPGPWTTFVDLVHGPLSWTTLVDHSRGPLSWTTLVDHSRGPLSWTTLVDHSRNFADRTMDRALFTQV
jgi:hypothetical protein